MINRKIMECFNCLGKVAPVPDKNLPTLTKNRFAPRHDPVASIQYEAGIYLSSFLLPLPTGTPPLPPILLRVLFDTQTSRHDVLYTVHHRSDPPLHLCSASLSLSLSFSAIRICIYNAKTMGASENAKHIFFSCGVDILRLRVCCMDANPIPDTRSSV